MTEDTLENDLERHLFLLFSVILGAVVLDTLSLEDKQNVNIVGKNKIDLHSLQQAIKTCTNKFDISDNVLVL